MVRFTDSESEPDAESGDRLAPVIPLFVGAPIADASPGDRDWHAKGGTDRSRDASSDPAFAETDRDEFVELAERALLKKLRARSLSFAEARSALRQHQLSQGESEALLQRLEGFGYLDDAALADQLVHTAVDRQNKGRQAIAQVLAKRGIPRDIADAALATLPDDDAERALEFARGKARSLRALDRDTALRRLVGQLARRGYGGSAALTAARTALDEAAAPSHGVRFD
ncbi:regulatory protein RecX [Microbacterium sp. BWT-B31]|uniref:regulatory protein RecX n=1 Tax=Microbacterium sp. BWT-B31 TaxID=3232072 RepID=UPI003528090F